VNATFASYNLLAAPATLLGRWLPAAPGYMLPPGAGSCFEGDGHA